MKYARLGRTGLEVSRLCLGTNMFGAGYVDDERAAAVFAAAFDAGVNFIDTADMYHDGLSEVAVGKATAGRRHDVVIATKGGMRMGPGVNDVGASRRHLTRVIEDSLRRLNTGYIDLYQVHQWDSATPLEETISTLDRHVREGKIRYLGCSNYAAWQLCKALWTSDRMGLERFESVQPAYNFTVRDPERELFPLCEDQNVGVLPYQVLMGGVLTGGYTVDGSPPPETHMSARHSNTARRLYWNRDHLDMAGRLNSIAMQADQSPSALVLAWVLSKLPVTSVIAGSSRPAQIAENARATELDLPQDILGLLDELGTCIK